jgi:hypothetical protein
MNRIKEKYGEEVFATGLHLLQLYNDVGTVINKRGVSLHQMMLLCAMLLGASYKAGSLVEEIPKEDFISDFSEIFLDFPLEVIGNVPVSIQQ